MAVIEGESEYHRSIREARRVALALTEDLADDLRELLEAAVERLEERVLADLGRISDQASLELARSILRQLAAEMAGATRASIELTASTVSTIYSEATTALFLANGVAAPVTFQRLNVRAAQAVLARGSLARSLRTIRDESIEAVEGILREAILEGVPQRQVAQRLRLHMLGAETLPDRLLLDRRRIGYAAIQELGYEPTRENLEAVRKFAGQIAHRARRIARTEPMVAQWEANRVAAVESPVVSGFRWKTSSRHQVEDQCDVLEDTDFYGLGPGVYPAERLPSRPHPHCMCRHLHVLREVSEWTQPKAGAPQMRDVPSAEVLELYPSQHESLVAALLIGEVARERVA